MKDRLALIISDIIKVEAAAVILEPASFGMMVSPGWDSLAQLAIMTAIEDELEVELSIDDMEALTTAEKIFEKFS